MPNTTTSSVTAEHRRQAAEWLVRLDSGQATVETLAKWRAADPRHDQAFAEQLDLWDNLRGAASLVAKQQSARLSTLATKGRRHSSDPAWATRWSWPVRLAGAAVAGPILAFALWISAPALLGNLEDLAADAATAPGERRIVALPDGSQVELAGDSAISLRFDDQRRAVTLLRGEAFFDVQPGQALPFTVAAGVGWTRVIGTQFNVRRDAGQVIVTVAKGKVAVGATGSAQETLLTAGTQAVVSQGTAGPAQIVDIDRFLAWRHDRVVFYRQTLAAVVSELNRQSYGRIVILRPELRDLVISGAFPTNDIEQTLAAITDTLGLQTAALTPWVHFLY